MDGKVFKDTPLSIPGVMRASDLPGVPPKIHQMRQMYEYGANSPEMQAKNFYRQGKFMEDFDDDATVSIPFQHYFPTYHDMNISQLRTYFTWRTDVRKGVFKPTSLSYLYMYIYELLNGIGVKSPEESLTKMEQLRTAYCDDSTDTKRMVNYLNRWAFDFCIINNLPRETTLKYADNSIDDSKAISVLLNAETSTDEELMAVFARFYSKKLENSPVIKKQGAKAIAYLTGIWRYLSNLLFTDIFGEKSTHEWNPLSSAVYYTGAKTEDAIYELFPALRYFYRYGVWYSESYAVAYPQKRAFSNFIGAVDYKLRKYFGTGGAMKNSEAYQPFFDYIDKAIKYCEDQSRPKINVNLSSLDQIRTDSVETCESLLTEEDRLDWSVDGSSANIKEDGSSAKISVDVSSAKTEDAPVIGQTSRLHSSSIENQILIALLQNTSITEIIKTNHLMPTILAERINEMYFDEFADNVVDCDGSTITLIYDYVEDLKNLLLS
ncbi:MAG: TerB N-terminal domain-containing protein [Bacteroidales bacterium]|nr:TerB N-terminal domain-containing protein [Bacteroidales bacterium]